MTSMGEAAAEANRYAVEVREEDGWWVAVRDPRGAVVFRRACPSEDEARTFASTVEQHIRWLSPSRFRAYYRIPEPEGG